MPRAPSTNSSSTLQRIKQTYAFFRQAERSKRRLSFQEMCQATGYSPKTIRSHLSNKWHWFLKHDQDGYSVEGLLPYSLEYFIALHRQKQTPLPSDPHAPPLTSHDRIVPIPVPLRPRVSILLAFLLLGAFAQWLSRHT